MDSCTSHSQADLSLHADLIPPPALQGWAELEAFCGQRDVARALFQEGLQYNFPTGRYMRQWALFEKKAGRPEAAEELFARAVQLSPRDYKSWLQVRGPEGLEGHSLSSAGICRRGVLVEVAYRQRSRLYVRWVPVPAHGCMS